MLRGFLKKFIYRISYHFWKAGPFSLCGDSFNVLKIAALQAALESSRYFVEHMPHVRAFDSDADLLKFAFREASEGGSVLEFGVASGRTINILASLTEQEVHGFDSFAGLPEFWRPGFDAGSFAQERPSVAKNVILHVGLFDETLSRYLQEDGRTLAFMHIDCDLYSSTRVVLDLAGERIIPGTIIVFDDYWNYPGWKEHEWKAFKEYISASGRSYEYIGIVPTHQQVAVKIVG